VSSYLEWQLNVDPLTLRNFNIAFSKISPHRTCLKPPPQTACPHIDCARTTRQANCVFCACSNLFFFPFPPDFVCSAIHPRPPMRFPAHLMSRIRSTNTIASLDELRGPHPPPNHATTAAPIALSLPPLPCHPRMPLYMPALKPHTHTTHKAYRGPCFCGGSNQ